MSEFDEEGSDGGFGGVKVCPCCVLGGGCTRGKSDTEILTEEICDDGPDDEGRSSLNFDFGDGGVIAVEPPSLVLRECGSSNEEPAGERYTGLILVEVDAESSMRLLESFRLL